MADLPPLSNADFDRIAEYLKNELEDRKRLRMDRERHWKEIDRQIAMEPKAMENTSGQSLDWYPAVEEPLQYNALEVILADLHSMIFPPGADWFSPLSNLSDEYLQRFEQRRRDNPLVGSVPDQDQTDTKLDQETADALVKNTLDFFHRTYDFRGKFNLFLTEQVKYGTGVTRVKAVNLPKFHHGYHGTKVESLIGPSLAPLSIWNVYRDPHPHFMLHEGVSTLPMTLVGTVQLFESLKRAAKVGGAKKGWRPGVVSRMKPILGNGIDRREYVEKITAEGDVIVPTNQGTVFLENVEITVAVGANGPKVVRLQKNPSPYRSFVFGDYLIDDPKNPYGGSPLLKGMSVQGTAAFILNDLLAVSRLNALPPVAYDKQDSAFYQTDGPEIYPGARWASDNPALLKVQEIGDLNGLFAMYSGTLQKFDHLTFTSDPRRGGGVKSHTGTNANLADLQRTVAPTQNVADDHLTGSLQNILALEYDIAKRNMTKPMAIPVDDVGIEGWVKLSAADLPDQVMFRVLGAAGLAQKQQDNQNFLTATQLAVQLVGVSTQLGKPINIDFIAIIAEAYQRAGVQNVAKYVRPAQATSPGPASASAPGGANGVPIGPEAALQTLQAQGGNLQL